MKVVESIPRNAMGKSKLATYPRALLPRMLTDIVNKKMLVKEIFPEAV